MTSKEALRRIKREAGTPYFSSIYNIDMWREDFKTVEKDLEVLEIIKVNHFEIDKDGNVYVGNICDVLLGIEDYYKDMEEEYNKIKEWLKKED